MVGCISPQKQPSKKPKVSYEEDLYPFIVEQINNTAATFFYDIEKANRNKDIPVVEKQESSNAIVGDNETGGVCQDYAFHFIDNFKGPGEVYFLSVDSNGKTELEKRIKLFERSDIIIFDKKTIDSFIEETYQVPTPESPAGETIEKFSNHAWVRIQWNGLIVDVDPTWHDNGRSLEEVIEVIEVIKIK